MSAFQTASSLIFLCLEVGNDIFQFISSCGRLSFSSWTLCPRPQSFSLLRLMLNEVCWLPEVEALSVRQDREGSTQRPLRTDEHDPEMQKSPNPNRLTSVPFGSIYKSRTEARLGCRISGEQRPSLYHKNTHRQSTLKHSCDSKQLRWEALSKHHEASENWNSIYLLFYSLSGHIYMVNLSARPC